MIKTLKYSSVVSSAPTIPWPRVQIPSTPSTLFSICKMSFELNCEKNENKQKRGQDWAIFYKH